MKIKETKISSPLTLTQKMFGKKPNQKVLEFNAGNQSKRPGNNTVGVTGTRIWGDVFNEEYVEDLKGYKAAVAYTKMLRRDYKVGFLETAIMATIKAAHYNFSQPETPKGEEIKEMCEWQMKQGFNKTHSDNLNDLASYKFYGFAAFEPQNWEYFKHDTFGDMWRLHNLGFKTQESIQQWGVDDRTEDLLYVKQQPQTGSVGQYTIPGENLIILTEKRRGANYEGRGILRTAYGPEFRKNIYYKLLGLGLEKSAIGIILVTVPPGKQGSDEETEFLEAVKNYVTHQNSFIKKVGNKLGEQWEGFDVEVITIDFKADSVISAIKLEDSAIASCGAAMFGELGQNGNSGAKSLGTAEIDFFFTTIIQDINYICEKTQPIYDLFTEYNFGKQKEYAKLEATMDDQMGLEFGQMLNYFSAVGAYTGQPEDEEMLRKKWKMPEYNKANKIELPDNNPEPKDDKSDIKDNKDKKDNKMSLTSQPDSYIRKITKGINIKGFIKEKKELVNVYSKSIKSQLLVAKDKYLIDVKNAIQKNSINPLKAVSNIEIGYTKPLSKKIEDSLSNVLHKGKVQGQDVLIAKGNDIKNKLADTDDFNVDDKRWVKNTGTVTTSIMTDTFKKTGLLAASNGLNKGLSESEVLFNINISMDKWINDERNLGGEALVPEGLSKGRLSKYKDEAVIMTGRIYTNYIPVTRICGFLNGKAIREGDPNVNRFTEPNHWRCDGFSTPILSDEPQPAIWDGWNPPDSVINAQQLLSCDCNTIPAHVQEILNYLNEVR